MLRRSQRVCKPNVQQVITVPIGKSREKHIQKPIQKSKTNKRRVRHGSRTNHTLFFYDLEQFAFALVARFLDNASYVSFVGSSQRIRNKLIHDMGIYQNHALDTVHMLHRVFDLKQNVYLSGSAGVGKSASLEKIRRVAIKLERKICVCGTTGAAASSLTDGRTLHSFSGLGKGNISVLKLTEKIESLKEKQREGNNHLKSFSQWKAFDLLVIDEVSMLGKRFLEKLNMVAQFGRGSEQPLGGIQVVFAGDFLQLSPVGDKFAFLSDVWKQLNCHILRLTFPHRQAQDLPFYRMLQRIRTGQHTDNDVATLEDRKEFTDTIDFESMDIKPTHLYSRHRDVNAVNQAKFEALETPVEITSQAVDTIVRRETDPVGGTWYVPFFGPEMTLIHARKLVSSQLDRQAPCELKFKEGAQYILTFNLDTRRGMVNGSRCVFLSGGWLKFKTGDVLLPMNKVVRKFYIPIPGFPHLCLVRKQYALRLGYSITIHGSQGITLDCAYLDLGSSVFANGQAYVALSRIKNMNSLYLKNFERKSIKTNKDAKKFEQITTQ